MNKQGGDKSWQFSHWTLKAKQHQGSIAVLVSAAAVGIASVGRLVAL